MSTGRNEHRLRRARNTRHRRWLSLRSGLFVGGLTSVLVLSLGATALAHYVYEYASVWDGPDGKCLLVYSEVSHGSGGGYGKTEVQSYTRWGIPWNIDCAQSWDKPPGYIKGKQQLYRWNATYRVWALCRSTNWRYNQTSTNVLRIKIYYNFYGDYTYPPCGSGYYGNVSWGQMNYNSTWVPSSPGRMWSGKHWLPT